MRSRETTPGPSRRRGFTVLEIVLAIGFLGIAAGVIGELAMLTLKERLRNETRLAVTEWATNVLEEARAMPWSELTPEWAANVQMPPELNERLVNPKANVVLVADRDRPAAKRLTITVQWTHSDGTPFRPVTLFTIISDRLRREGQ